MVYLKAEIAWAKKVLENIFFLKIFFSLVFISQFSFGNGVTYTDLFMEKLDVFNCFHENRSRISLKKSKAKKKKPTKL